MTPPQHGHVPWVLWGPLGSHGCCGLPWVLWISHGCYGVLGFLWALWVSHGCYGVLGGLMGVMGLPWVLLGALGFPWVLWVSHGCSGVPWVLWVSCGYYGVPRVLGGDPTDAGGLRWVPGVPPALGAPPVPPRHPWVPPVTRRDYAAVIFFANSRFETGKRRLQFLSFGDLAACAQSMIMMQHWTQGALGEGTPRGHHGDTLGTWGHPADTGDRDILGTPVTLG
uniref:Uncharacterized protein n=1 Tax=Apteryx owenii TaxID=8824 RepID=A0A8B9QAG2_APTOW